MTLEQKNKALILLVKKYSQVAGELWELADAYSGGESEGAEELARRMDCLDADLDYLLEK